MRKRRCNMKDEIAYFNKVKKIQIVKKKSSE